MTYDSDVLALSPSSYWRLGGNGTDASPNGRDLTINGTPSYVTGAIAGNTALRGTATIPLAAWMTSPAALTVIAWFKQSNAGVLGSTIALAGQSDSTTTDFNNRWRLFVDGPTGKVRAQVWQTNGVINGNALSSAGHNDSQWHMAALVWSGSNLKIYVDGVQEASVSATATMATFSWNLFVGHLNGNQPVTNDTAGAVDEVATWFGTALTGGQISALYAAATVTAPGVPTSVTATPHGTSIDLSWSAPATGSAPTSYEVRIDGGSATTATSPHSFTGLTPGTSYTVEVRAVNSAGSSSYVGSTLSTLSLPGTPTSLTVTDEAVDEITVTWAAPASGGTVDGYDVRVDGGTPTDVDAVLTHTFTGLTPVTTYTLEVRAYGPAGDGSWASVSGTTAGAPGSPTDVEAVSTSTTSITMTWGPPSTGGPPESYEVRIDGGTPIDVGTLETHVFAGLTAGTVHTVDVRAVNSAGESAWVSRILAVTSTLPPTRTPGRIYAIGAEERAYIVGREDRTIRIPAEDRTYVITRGER